MVRIRSGRIIAQPGVMGVMTVSLAAPADASKAGPDTVLDTGPAAMTSMTSATFSFTAGWGSE